MNYNFSVPLFDNPESANSPKFDWVVQSFHKSQAWPKKKKLLPAKLVDCHQYVLHLLHDKIKASTIKWLAS